MARFKVLPLSEDPLRGAGGLSWYQRAPSSLTKEEWDRLDRALAEGVISASEYVDWKQHLRGGPRLDLYDVNREDLIRAQTGLEKLIGPTYQVGETDGRAWILCTKCGMKSFNPSDIAEKYCGHCHEFHR